MGMGGQYGALYQASLQNQIMQMQRAQQTQSDLMIAQQQMWELNNATRRLPRAVMAAWVAAWAAMLALAAWAEWAAARVEEAGSNRLVFRSFDCVLE